MYAGYEDFVKAGFDIHEFDNVKNANDFFSIIENFYYENGHIDNHIKVKSYYNEKHYKFKKYDVLFTNEYGTKEEFLAKGYIENETMFYYPSNDIDNPISGKVWRKGQILLRNIPSVVEPIPDISLYETRKSVMIKIPEFKKAIPYNKKFKEKEFIIIDLRSSIGGESSLIVDFLHKLKHFDGKIILLYNKQSASAAEMFYFYIKNTYINNNTFINYQNNVFVIGTNTEGMFKYGIYKYNSCFDFPELKFKLYLPNFKSNCNFYDFKEGYGIFPDIWAQTDKEILKVLQWYTNDEYLTRLL